MLDQNKISPTPRESNQKPVRYKGHIPGSRKSRCHEIYDEQGREPAKTMMQSMDLKPSTVKNWLKEFRRQK